MAESLFAMFRPVELSVRQTARLDLTYHIYLAVHADIQDQVSQRARNDNM